MNKKIYWYIGGGLLALYILRWSYKKYKVDYEEVSEIDKKELLVTQVLIKNNEADTPLNRAKYESMSIAQLESLLVPTIPSDGPSGPEPSDTTGAGSW